MKTKIDILHKKKKKKIQQRETRDSVWKIYRHSKNLYGCVLYYEFIYSKVKNLYL